MPRRTAQEWIRLSARTPGIFIFGMVMAPCGWILNLTSTVAPNWRTLHNIPGEPVDAILQQGIFDICRAFDTAREVTCNQQDTAYFNNQVIEIAQAMMVASLIVTLIGLAVAIPGIRCWRTEPNWTVAGLGGLLIWCSGVLTLIPIAWYTHVIKELAVTGTSNAATMKVGFSIILGYIGGIMEFLGGFVMFIGICRCCGGKNRGERPLEEVMAETGGTAHFRHQKAPPRRMDLPPPSLNRSRSSASSVPYSKDSMDDDVSFPRAKSPANTRYSGDADL